MDDFEKTIKNATTPLPGSIPETVTYKLSVKLKNDGLSLLELYSKSFPHIKTDVWIDKINAGLLTVNGQKCAPHFKLKAGWITENIVHGKTEPNVNNDIQFIYEDNEILVLNKPAPLPMHPSGRFNRNTLTEILKLSFPTEAFKIVHRLDANTTGVIILAKNSNTANSISQQFQENTIKKEYLALVEGIVTHDMQVINKKISTDKTSSGGREISDDGLESETKLTVLARDPELNQTLLKVEPKNGRTNQIRLHLASIDHSIVGDLGYKDEQYFKNNPLTYPNDSLFLHAHKIIIRHNSTEKQFIAKIPKKFSDKISF